MNLRILGGRWKGRMLQSPRSISTRPTQGVLRQAVFNICQCQIEDALFLDLFAGSGAMGLEALSRGAKKAVLVEKDLKAADCIRKNISLLQTESQAELLIGDLMHALKKLSKRNISFSLIYIDPPYEKSALLPEILDFIENHGLLAKEGTLFIETSSKDEEQSYACKELQIVNIRTFGIARLYQLQ